MRRLLLALVGLLVLAPQAGAVDIAVTNDATMTAANAAVSAGDRVLIADGTYTVAINPAVSGGLASRITYIGNIANPAAVSVPGLSITKNCITVKGVASTGGLTISGAARSDSILYCTGTTLGVQWGSQNHIRFCTVSGTGDVAVFDCENTATPLSGAIGDSNSVADCNITAKKVFFRGADYFTYERNRETLTIPSGEATDTHFRTMYVCANWLIRDNHLTARNDDDDTRRLMQVRDSTKFGRIVRDTMVVSASGTQNVSGFWTTSGAYNRVYNIDVDSCFIRTNNEGVNLQQNSFGMRFRYTTIVSENEAAHWVDGVACDGLTFDHCTLVGLSGAFRGVVAQDGTAGTNHRITNSIIYGGTISSAGGDHLYFHGPVPPSTQDIDYNLYYAPAGDGAGQAVRFQFTNSAVGTGTAWNGEASHPDSFSVFASPRFADSTYASFDPALGSGSFAIGGSWPDGYVGAIDPAGADVTPPAAVDALTWFDETTTTADLVWEAPEDPEDGTCTAYDIRWSTSSIDDETDWDAATQATGEPTPSSPVTEDSFTLTGLPSATLIYVAIKSQDGSGNWSDFTATSGTTDTPGSPVVAGQMEVYPNYNTAGVTVWYSGDTDMNSSARLFVQAGASATTDTTYEAFPLDTIRSDHALTGSVFWLAEGTQYTATVIVNDPDGGTDTLSTTFTTRQTRNTAVTGTTYHVAAWGAGSDSAAGTAAAPFRTLAKAWSVMTAGDAMQLASGMHIDTLVTAVADSGTPAAPKWILGTFPDTYLSGEDAAYSLRSDWDSLTVNGQKLYRQVGFPTFPRTIVFGDSMALFRHPTANSLTTDSLGTAGNMQYGWARSNTGDTLYVQLEGGASPNGYRAHIANRTYLLTIRSNNVVVDGVGARFAGTDWRTNYYLNVGITLAAFNVNNAKNVTIRGGYFLNNSGWNAISVDSLGASSRPNRDITIERNLFRDTRVAGWGLYTSFTIYQHPVVFVRSGRGTVVRDNTYRGFKDGGLRVDELVPGLGSDLDFNDNDLMDWTRDSDAYEPDATHGYNFRAWNNRAKNGGSFSDTEVRRGPHYYLNNQAVSVLTGFLVRTAFTDSTYGPVHLFHNTVVCNFGAPITGIGNKPMRGWHGVNNIFATNYRVIDDQQSKFPPPGWSFNYDYWVGNRPAVLFGTTYEWADTTTFRANLGWQRNGRWNNHVVGAAFADTANRNVTLATSSPANEAGRRINGINRSLGVNRFTSVPEMGAVENSPPDLVAPYSVIALAVTGTTDSTVTLAWTAPGDDGAVGTASNYDIRYYSAPITEANWASATPLSGEPSPASPGSAESWETGAVFSAASTHHFAMKTNDEGRSSLLSNSVSGTTTGVAWSPSASTGTQRTPGGLRRRIRVRLP